MDLNTFIIAVFCLIDDRIEDRALRARGPLPRLSDAEVLTIEIVGEFLGLDTDEAIFRYFRRHYGEWFPALGEVHRTTFARQAANLWKIKERLWQELLDLTPHDRAFAMCDSMALAGVPVRPRLPLLSLSWGGSLRQGHAAQANLLRFQGAREGLLAWGDHPHLGGPGQRPRTPRAPGDRRGNLWPDRRRPQLPFAKDQRGVGGHGRGASGPVLFQEKRPYPEQERPFEPASLPNRHGLFAAHRTLLRKAGVGARPLAFDESAAEEGAESYLGLLAQPSGGQPTSATSEAPPLRSSFKTSSVLRLPAWIENW